MKKYIIKESKLRSVIESIIMEEITCALNEGRLGNFVKKTAGLGLVGVIAPSVLPLVLADRLKNRRGGNFSRGENRTRKTKAERQRERLRGSRYISYDYGKPETVPGFGRRTKLASKTEITAPDTGKGIDWGEFGRHYHDEGDRAWNRKFTDTENAFIRNDGKYQKRYKRILVDWLKDRDREYEIYIKSLR